LSGEAPIRRETARLFLALWPSPRLRKALLEHQEAWRWPPRASLVRPEKLHLTLHFIGNVPRDRVALFIKELEVPFLPFTLDFGPPELWHSGVAVLQPKAPPAGLQRLHDALGQALQQLELPVESREFRPHITLARRASGSLAPTDKPVLHWPVRSYVLVESRPEPASRYRLLKRYT
jgi:2'-5' RNA ligase